MSARHTSGPWQVVTTPNPVLSGRNWREIASKDGSVLAEVFSGRDEEPEDEGAAANARLIAAAPDMLEGLKVLVDLIEDELPPDRAAPGDDRMANAKALIAKIEGAL